MSKDIARVKKRRISHISTQAESLPYLLHQKIRIEGRQQCAACRGLRITDRPPKRVALGEITTNNQRKSMYTKVRYRCKQYDVYLCKTGLCWQTFHEIKSIKGENSRNWVIWLADKISVSGGLPTQTYARHIPISRLCGSSFNSLIINDLFKFNSTLINPRTQTPKPHHFP
jgi:hypothetical protein